ncbi:bestrophin-like domain [Actinomadura sp. 3N407]|uniref:bestrophin-like domain n=1 Tax=Actinomadura sp. 3N407 TaxID=3457423 RepID=UPI003FCDA0CF
MIVHCAAAGSAVAVVIVASRLVRRTRRAVDDPDPDGPTTSHAGAMLSALFLLAFAIAIVVPWTSSDAARSNTYTESQAIAEASWAATRLPEADARHVQRKLREYVDLVRGPEWRLMKNGRLSPRGWAELDGLRRDVIAVEAGTDELKDARAAVLAHLGEISAARRQRAMDARSAPPAGLLAVTVVTGAAVVLLPFLSGARPRGMTLVPLSLMAALLAAGTYLTIDISHVFDGALAVGPEAFTGLRAELQRIAGGG